MPGGVQVQGPDGKTYQFPTGTDKAAAIGYFKKKGIGAAPAVKPPEKTTASLPKWEQPPGRVRTATEQAGAESWSKEHAPGVLATVGSMMIPGGGGFLAKAGLAAVGAGAGSAMGQAAAGKTPSAEKTSWDAVSYGAAPEAIGGALVKAGEQLAPAAIKKLATKLFAGRMDVAGKAIDTYLSQPALSGIKIDAATPLNKMLDDKIAKATRAGATSLADRLTQLKTDWNASYNLKDPTLMELNAFKREIADFTSFAGEANKASLNSIQKQAVGLTSGLIEKAAPGIKPLNEAYGNIAGGAKAARSSARKLTSGFTGLGLSMAGTGLKGAGEITPDTIRAIMASLQGGGPQQAPVPSN